jgi:hypothetical protein
VGDSRFDAGRGGGGDGRDGEGHERVHDGPTCMTSTGHESIGTGQDRLTTGSTSSLSHDGQDACFDARCSMQRRRVLIRLPRPPRGLGSRTGLVAPNGCCSYFGRSRGRGGVSACLQVPAYVQRSRAGDGGACSGVSWESLRAGSRWWWSRSSWQVMMIWRGAGGRW